MRHEYSEISGSERILYAGLYAVDLHWSSEWNYPPNWVVLGFWILVKPLPQNLTLSGPFQ